MSDRNPYNAPPPPPQGGFPPQTAPQSWPPQGGAFPQQGFPPPGSVAPIAGQQIPPYPLYASQQKSGSAALIIIALIVAASVLGVTYGIYRSVSKVTDTATSTVDQFKDIGNSINNSRSTLPFSTVPSTSVDVSVFDTAQSSQTIGPVTVTVQRGEAKVDGTLELSVSIQNSSASELLVTGSASQLTQDINTFTGLPAADPRNELVHIQPGANEVVKLRFTAPLVDTPMSLQLPVLSTADPSLNQIFNVPAIPE